MTIEPLTAQHVSQGLLECLSVFGVTRPDSRVLQERLRRQINTLVCVERNRVVGTAAFWMEPKFLHDGSWVCHVEDVAVLPNYRRQGIARELLARIESQAITQGCYKIVLDCNRSNVAYYARMGYRKAEVQMRKDLV